MQPVTAPVADAAIVNTATVTRRIASVDVYRGFVMLLMMAEVGWTTSEKKSYLNFKDRLTQHVKHLEKLQVKFAPYFLTETATAQPANPNQ